MVNRNTLKNIPNSPGVYLFKDSNEKIIYIGKAKVLKTRVRSYFNKTKHQNTKTVVLVKKIQNLDWIVVRDEVEAILTEANLIKEHRPKYNVSLKDDKTFPYIQITNEPYPQVILMRTKKLQHDGSYFFGPYTDIKYLRHSLKVLHKVFPIRSCSYFIDANSISEQKHKICLDYHIKRCEGPCEGRVSQKRYNQMIHHIKLFLRGRDNKIRSYLKSEMKTASDNLKFEDAARFRDQLNAVNTFMRRQKKITQDGIDRDILVTHNQDSVGIGIVLKVRNGFFIAKEKFDLNINLSVEKSIMTYEFLKQYYASTHDFPKEILLREKVLDSEYLEKWLQKISNKRIKIKTPQRGEKRKLVNICIKNADLLLNEILIKKQKRKELIPTAIQMLQEDLSMAVPPRRIEAFDNSNIQGKFPVAGLVVFLDGKPLKKEYRKYNIKSVNGIDDFKSMYEVVHRRYSRQLEEKQILPDLILIDGGKGQLSSAKSALDHLGLGYITIIGLAKRMEEVFLPQFSQPQNISKSSPGLLLLRKIRDEVHRFAITFHRQKRQKEQFQSLLNSVQGMGEKRIKHFWSKFDSLGDIKKLSLKELKSKTGFPANVCMNLIDLNKK